MCNCRGNNICPLDGKCLLKDIVYNGKCSGDGVDAKNYIGLTATTFKVRHSNHKTAFKNENSLQSTTLSTYFWKLKKEGKNPRVSFSVLKKSKSFTPESGRCALCLAEKLLILKSDPKKIVNKRSEIMSTCRHRLKYILEQFKPN